MRKLNVFNFTSLNGCYKGANQDISWHRHGQEESEYAAESMKGESILLFGRVTYEMMASAWQSEQAKKNAPRVAEGMNKAEKIVFSKTLKTADWANTRIMDHNIYEEIRQLKQTPGNDMTILGSGSILSQFAAHGLIDEFLFMIDPVVVTGGVPIFKDLPKNLNLKLTQSRVFKSGVVLVGYTPL